MILKSTEIQELCRENPPLIEDADPLQMEPGGLEAGAYDLRVDKIFVPLQGISWPRIGRDTRSLPDVRELPPVSDCWCLMAPLNLLLQTIETVNLPADLRGFIVSRTSLFRAGWGLQVGPVHPGFSGKLVFALFSFPFTKCLELERGARIASIVFARIPGGEPTVYGGIWSGDKVTTDGEERGF